MLTSRRFDQTVFFSFVLPLTAVAVAVSFAALRPSLAYETPASSPFILPIKDAAQPGQAVPLARTVEQVEKEIEATRKKLDDARVRMDELDGTFQRIEAESAAILKFSKSHSDAVVNCTLLQEALKSSSSQDAHLAHEVEACSRDVEARQTDMAERRARLVKLGDEVELVKREMQDLVAFRDRLFKDLGSLEGERELMLKLQWAEDRK